MQATTFDILGRPRSEAFELTSIHDFELQETGWISAEKILTNQHITLYSLDFENELAVFVETPPEVNLSHAPFYFLAQFNEAIRVLTLPFEDMLQLAETVAVPEERLVFIHSTGRAGSTLASQLFAPIPGVINLSEPDALTELVFARCRQPDNKAQLMALLKATVALLCKTEADVAWVIKGRSYILELGDWLHELFPQAKNVFLYRSADSWMKSCMNAYFAGSVETEAERRMAEKSYRAYKLRFIPAIRAINPQQYLSFADIMSIEWLSMMERYTQFSQMGIVMLAIPYAHWRAAPRKTTEAMLDYCGCRPADLTTVYEALDRDSQAGTELAQAAVKQHQSIVTDHDFAVLRAYVEQHAFVNRVDFEVANSLQLQTNEVI